MSYLLNEQTIDFIPVSWGKAVFRTFLETGELYHVLIAYTGYLDTKFIV